jgi:hypothetical protein
VKSVYAAYPNGSTDEDDQRSVMCSHLRPDLSTVYEAIQHSPTEWNKTPASR